LCLALLSGCAAVEGERSGIFSGADSAAPDAVPDAKERSGFFSGTDSAAPDAVPDAKERSGFFSGADSAAPDAVPDAKERSGFYSEADRASRRQDWIRFRPDATSPFSGVEQPHANPYSGQVSFSRGLYDLGATSALAGTTRLEDLDGYGLWISARPSEWYIAPELGFISSKESNGLLKSRVSEFFAGGRVIAELPFTPFSVIAGMGISQVKGRLANIIKVEESGFYFHGGAMLHMGDHAHFALDYRTVNYSDDDFVVGSNMDVITLMLGVNW
jgi:hypothetical protein